LSLGGIVWSRTLPLAIINEALVGVGDSVAGRKVVRIGRDEVVVEINARKERLKPTPPGLGLRIGRSRPQE
jgi:type II secretory pathway component PulC